MKYQDKKEAIRQEAIDWQISWETYDFSYGEVSFWINHFYQLGKKYGLVKEFKENGII